MPDMGNKASVTVTIDLDSFDVFSNTDVSQDEKTAEKINTLYLLSAKYFIEELKKRNPAADHEHLKEILFNDDE